MGVFGTEHLVDASDIAQVVPSWMPAHLFWTYLVGVALIAAALSIVLNRHARLAATLLGSMLLLFVVLIHIPNIVGQHGARLFWMIALRDTAFSGGAFALAGSLSKRAPSDGTPWLVTVGRFFVGIPAIVFGVEDILYPAIVPGIPLARITPTWIPGHIFWSLSFGRGSCGDRGMHSRKCEGALGRHLSGNHDSASDAVCLSPNPYCRTTEHRQWPQLFLRYLDLEWSCSTSGGCD